MSKLFRVTIFTQNLQNKKSYKVIVRYLAEIFQLIHLTVSAELHMLMITRQMQRETVFKNFIGSRKSLKNIVSKVQFVIYNPWKASLGGIAFN